MAGLALTVAASPASAAAPTFDERFDASDTPLGSFGFVWRMSADEATGDIYVLATAPSAVHRLTASGEYLSSFTAADTPAGLFLGLESDIAVDNTGGPNQGTVYVLDVGTQALQAIGPDGEYRWQATGFFDACGVDVDSEGNPWVADYATESLLKFNPDGTPAMEGGQQVQIDTSWIWGGANANCHFNFTSSDDLYVAGFQDVFLRLNAPDYDTVIAVDSGSQAMQGATDDVTGDFYSAKNNQVAVYDSSNALVAGTPFASDTPDYQGIAVDGSHGRIYLSDFSTASIEAWNRAGGPGPKPSARLGDASGIGSGEATLNAKVNPNGQAVTSCEFEYGPDTDFGSTAPCQPGPGGIGNGNAEVAVSGHASDLEAGTVYFRLVVENANGTTTSSTGTFEATGSAPAVTTTPGATGITSTSATVAGTVNPRGEQVTSCEIQYGTTTSYGSSVPCEPADLGTGSEPVDVEAQLTGLNAGTTYHFRVVAENANGVGEGDDETFTTLVAAPAVTTGAAEAISQTTATLKATVNANGASASCEFEYVDQASHAESGFEDADTAQCSPNPVSGATNTPVSAAVSGLSPNTTYVFRVVATNDGGTTHGEAADFTTLAEPPVVSTQAPTAVGDTSAVLHGVVNPNGADADCEFQYTDKVDHSANGYANASVVPCSVDPVSGTADTAVSAAVTGLEPKTTYVYRVVAANNGGTSEGEDEEFSTTNETAYGECVDEANEAFALAEAQVRKLETRAAKQAKRAKKLTQQSKSLKQKARKATGKKAKKLAKKASASAKQARKAKKLAKQLKAQAKNAHQAAQSQLADDLEACEEIR